MAFSHKYALFWILLNISSIPKQKILELQTEPMKVSKRTIERNMHFSFQGSISTSV